MYIKFKDPVTKVVAYYRQTCPIYGEVGAPARWENTIAPWLESEGYVRGCNESIAFYNPNRDVLLLTCADDLMYDGEEDNIQWSDDRPRLEERFGCKDTDWLCPDMEPMDSRWSTLYLSLSRIHLSMKVYIENCIVLLHFEDLMKTSYPKTPICTPIDGASDPLPDCLRSIFMTAIACLGCQSPISQLGKLYSARFTTYTGPGTGLCPALQKMKMWICATSGQAVATVRIDGKSMWLLTLPEILRYRTSGGLRSGSLGYRMGFQGSGPRRSPPLHLLMKTLARRMLIPQAELQKCMLLGIAPMILSSCLMWLLR